MRWIHSGCLKIICYIYAIYKHICMLYKNNSTLIATSFYCQIIQGLQIGNDDKADQFS